MQEAETRGQFLQRCRTERKRTQKWVAEQALLSDRTVLRAEKDQEVSSENLDAICLVLGIDPADVPRRRVDPDAAAESAESEVVADAVVPDEVRRRGLLWIPANVAAIALASLLLWTTYPYEPFLRLVWPELAQSYGEMAAVQDIQSVLGRVVDTLVGSDSKPVDDMALQSIANWLRTVELDPKCRFPYEVGSDCGSGENSIVRAGDGGFLVVIGPSATDGFFANIVRKLPRTSELDLGVAVTRERADPLSGLLWFDPRGIADSEFPRDTVGNYLHMVLKGPIR